ncbi:uncharacterized protein L201_001473 [Kwoniella dendrophila CBS 6074]|uniref:Something about silencing protein 4 domain-containing protein n=1 Tax=Kwoniella dendrophila CBS 6074 TaxID=1295534 RepID=A0AAX4JMF3_9TREE
MTYVARQPTTTKLTHPALLTTTKGSAAPPHTPLSPSTLTNSKNRASHISPQIVQPPVVNYAMLREHHAYALKNTIARLRWDQVNNLYLPNQDADWNHNEMISKLEKELNDVQEAQKGLDKFPTICHAPTAFPKPHGPLTNEKHEELKELEELKEKKINEQLDKDFSGILRQLFIGPKTKLQWKRDELLRHQLKEGDLEEISMLIPTENRKWMMLQQEKRAHGHGHPHNRKPYEQQRLEKENRKIKANLAKIAKEKAEEAEAKGETGEKKQKIIGPLTKEEWHASLPISGPKTEQQANLLPLQRAQRHAIISWLQRPWGNYNEKASKAMEALAELAKESLEEEKISREKMRAKKGEQVKQSENEKEKVGGSKKSVEKVEKDDIEKSRGASPKKDEEVEKNNKDGEAAKA